jgi:phosphoglycolate phosphatase-like HAD superfamily hydrolase
MVRRAMAELNIDPAQSWLIGDSTTDLQTAKNAGLKSVLVRTGHGGRDAKHKVQPDFSFDTIANAVDFIVRQHSKSSSL